MRGDVNICSCEIVCLLEDHELDEEDVKKFLDSIQS